jgi:hypothetical protein
MIGFGSKETFDVYNNIFLAFLQIAIRLTQKKLFLTIVSESGYHYKSTNQTIYYMVVHYQLWLRKFQSIESRQENFDQLGLDRTRIQKNLTGWFQ